MPNIDLATTRAAKRHGVDPAILKRLIKQESGGNNKARSPAGARGIAQFIPSTAKAYGVNLNDNRISDDLDGAARYLAANLKRTGGNYAEALSIYNSGRPDGYKRFAETKNYVKSILGGSDSKLPSSSPSTSPSTPSSGDSDLRRQAALAYLQSGATNPLELVYRYQALKQANPSSTTPQALRSAPKASGTVDFEGTKVSSGIGPILQYARQKGWQGKVTSGVRTDQQQLRIYQSGVRPAAIPKALGGGGSNHEQTGWLKGAVDVTDPEQLDKILRKKNSRLHWAGAKDTPHYSFSGDKKSGY